LNFDATFIGNLFYAGLLPICTTLGRKNDPIFVLLPKLHSKRTVVLDPIAETVRFSKSTHKHAKKYILSVSRAFTTVVEACIAQHGQNCWLYPPLVTALHALRGGTASRAKIHSIELRDASTGELVAGEIGYTVGAVYTSMTGFYSRSGTGSVQLFLLSQLLSRQGFRMWDLGMSIDYKLDMGAVELDRMEFVNMFRACRDVEGVGLE
jgi:Leu/Phe-tRNA-protein transferase